MKVEDGIGQIRKLRPWKDGQGRSWVTSTDGKGKEPSGAEALFSKVQWLEMDRIVAQQMRLRAPLVCKLMEVGLTFGGFDGMEKMVLEEQVGMTADEPDAIVNMDGLTDDDSSEPKAPLFQMTGLPLPITSHNCSVHPGQLDDVALSARRVAEKLEETFLGVGKPFEVINQRIFGLLNHPDRTRATSVRAAVDLLFADRRYGPYVLCQGNPKLNVEVKIVKEHDGKEFNLDLSIVGSPMMREQAVLFQATPDVIRAVVGQGIVPMQQPGAIGDDRKSRTNVKVMAIVVPQIRKDFFENVGIVEIA